MLVSNARFFSFGQTAERDEASVDRLFAADVPTAHVLAEVLASKAAAPGDGSLISLGSVAAGSPWPAALPTATRRPWRRDPFLGRVQSLRYPSQCHRFRAGPDLTGAPPTASRQSAPQSCRPRPPRGGVIASVVAFLASPKASCITGAAHEAEMPI